jgi:hypothetical protein
MIEWRDSGSGSSGCKKRQWRLALEESERLESLGLDPQDALLRILL